MLWAETSESPIAMKARPVAERSRLRTASVTSPHSAKAMKQNASVEPRSRPKSCGVVTDKPALPLVTLSHRASTSSTMKPNDSVAMARQMPLTRSAGKPTTTPTAADKAPASAMLTGNGQPRAVSTAST